MSKCFFLADIGGTNTRVGLADENGLISESITRYRNKEYPSFTAVIQAYLHNYATQPIEGAAVAVAGPVTEQRAELTNRDWVIQSDEVTHTLNANSCILINDLQAQGYGLGAIADEYLPTVLRVEQPGLGATQLVCGIGTGFNIATVYHLEDRRFVPQSEAGHMRNAVPQSALPNSGYEGFIANEDLLSGRGLERLYSTRHVGFPARSAAEIFADYNTTNCPRASHSIESFARIAGHIIGDLALCVLPFGGIYLSGGVARALRPELNKPSFVDAFRDKDRFSAFMRQFSIFVIEDDFAALHGCAYAAQIVAK